jgi:hypothetical protein
MEPSGIRQAASIASELVRNRRIITPEEKLKQPAGSGSGYCATDSINLQSVFPDNLKSGIRRNYFVAADY